MKKIKSIFKDKKVYIFLLITLLYFGIFLRMDYATDTYSVLMTPSKEIISHFLLSGRFVTAIWYGISNLILSSSKTYFISFVIAILACTFSLYKLYNILKEDVKNDLLCMLIATIIIINPFSIELFLYIEKGILMLSIFLCICAVNRFIKFLKAKEKKTNNKDIIKNIIISLIYMLIATFSYQGTLAIFIAISCVYIVKYSKNVKNFIINNILMFLIYGIPAAINLLTVRVFFTNERVNGEIIIKESIEKVISGSKNMLQTYNILPKNFYLILLAIVVVLSIILIFINKREEKNINKILKVLSIIYVSFITIFMTILPIAMQNTASIWFVSRSSYTFASLLGILTILGLIIGKEENKAINALLIGILLLLLVAQYKSFNKIEIDHYNVNYLDKVNSMKIGKVIKEYEEKSGNKITKISIYQDENQTYVYKNIFATGDINITGFATDWSDVKMINYYNNTNLEKVENNEEIKDLFKGMDWDDFSKEQIILIDDTVHFCKF